MSWQPSRRRKRNKSSPLQKNIVKKHKAVNDSDTDLTWSDIEESDSENTYFPPALSPKMAAKLNKSDLKEIAKIIANELKEDLINEVKAEIKKMIQKETADLRNEIDTLKAENKIIKSDLHTTVLQLDELEQYGRRMCLDISGISGDKGDFSENVEEKVLNLFSKTKLSDGTQLPITGSDIDRCHRKGKYKGSNRKVIIKFTNSKARQSLYSARKQLGKTIFVQENITNFREGISYEARKLVRSNKLSKTWVAGCKVYGSLPGDSQKIIIRDMACIEAIRDDLPLPKYDAGIATI